MADWKSILVPVETPLLEVMKVIDRSNIQIALVVDGDGHLLGTVTDGDVRRGILGRVPLEDPVEGVMNRRPITARDSDREDHILAMMNRLDVKYVPVLDAAGRVVGLKGYRDVAGTGRKDNIVVLMAGGLGTRLRPLTDDCPKPMLPVGGKPILQSIIENFIRHGFHSFYVAVNFKSEMIERFFGDGGEWGVEIRYLREEQRLGTGGAISLLPERPERPFLVMNGDLLTTIDIRKMMDLHREQKATATIGVRQYDVQVPFGVVRIEGSQLVALEEKPRHSYFINAGIYCLDPVVYDMVPKGCSYDMTQLIQAMLDAAMSVATFPIWEYWLDVGRANDLERANGDFCKHFG